MGLPLAFVAEDEARSPAILAVVMDVFHLVNVAPPSGALIVMGFEWNSPAAYVAG